MMELSQTPQSPLLLQITKLKLITRGFQKFKE